MRLTCIEISLHVHYNKNRFLRTRKGTHNVNLTRQYYYLPQPTLRRKTYEITQLAPRGICTDQMSYSCPIIYKCGVRVPNRECTMQIPRINFVLSPDIDGTNSVTTPETNTFAGITQAFNLNNATL